MSPPKRNGIDPNQRYGSSGKTGMELEFPSDIDENTSWNKSQEFPPKFVMYQEIKVHTKESNHSCIPLAV